MNNCNNIRYCCIKGPKGEKGDKGEIGPRGLPGEIGRTEHIAIDETETLEPGEPATVMDTFENWVHHLAFSIPKGEKGRKRRTWSSRKRLCIFLWN